MANIDIFSMVHQRKDVFWIAMTPEHFYSKNLSAHCFTRAWKHRGNFISERVCTFKVHSFQMICNDEMLLNGEQKCNPNVMLLFPPQWRSLFDDIYKLMSLINKLSDWPPNYHKTPTIDVLVSGYGEVNFEPNNIYKQVHTRWYSHRSQSGLHWKMPLTRSTHLWKWNFYLTRSETSTSTPKSVATL